MLQEGVGDHGHQRMSVQSMPGTTFEVIEPEFFLHLVMCLLAHPACLDGRSQRSEITGTSTSL